MNARQLTVEEAAALLELGADVRAWYTDPHETFADTMKEMADAKSYKWGGWSAGGWSARCGNRQYNITYWVLEE